jgi:hypothetical protein
MSTVAWIWAVGMLGSKTMTFAPRSSEVTGGGEAAAVPLHDSAAMSEVRKRAAATTGRTRALTVDGITKLRRFIGAPTWGDEVLRPIG